MERFAGQSKSILPISEALESHRSEGRRNRDVVRMPPPSGARAAQSPHAFCVAKERRPAALLDHLGLSHRAQFAGFQVEAVVLALEPPPLLARGPVNHGALVTSPAPPSLRVRAPERRSTGADVVDELAVRVVGHDQNPGLPG